MDAGFRVETTRDREQGSFAWTLEDVPVDVLGSLVGGPLAWMEGGTAGLKVEDAWSTKEHLDVKTQWTLKLRDITGQVPEDKGMMTRASGNALFKFLEFKKEVDLTFGLDINPDVFKGNANLNASLLGAELEKALIEAGAEKMNANPAEVKELWDKTKEQVSSILDKARNKEE